MTLLMSIFLGIIQGITEFFPISSSGHLAVLQNMFNINEPDLLFEVLVHLGTLIAVCFAYRKDLYEMIRDGLEYLRLKSDSHKDEPITLKPPGRALLFIILATLPMFVAVFFYGAISRLFFNTFFIGFALIVTGGLLFVSSRYIKQGNKTEKTMTAVDAIIIGLVQAVALLPGLSRSGTTISVGLARGLNGQFAVRFSLLLSIPAILGSAFFEIFNLISEGADFALLPIYLIGFLFATIVGFFAIQFLRRIMAKGNLGYFAYYCWLIGIIVIIWSLFNI
ncbi:MAG: undecaprenyl-diphosphate phosphatase [Oscillospiraceae bacterium]|jgi:undecaprenyl-diphosphatase|nr:undecaprenyl-diphosphate phosphatase [Oscillospiraceae bacterium]